MHYPKKKKKNPGDFKCTMPPWLCNSKWLQHTLQMFTDHYDPRHTIQWKTIKEGLMQPQGELYPCLSILNHRNRDQLLEFCTSSMRQLAVNSLSKGIQPHPIFTKALLLKGLELTTSCIICHHVRIRKRKHKTRYSCVIAMTRTLPLPFFWPLTP